MSNYSDSSFARDENSSWFKVFQMIKPDSKVLDVGCSSGNFGKVLIDEKQCIVHGIELDKKDFQEAQQKLHKTFQLNIETDNLDELDTDYDYVYFGDVIEHLVTPGASLQRVLPLLKDNGRLLFSVPNMTHILVRLMLLQGKFEYGETGLLDKTHLHYYDYDFLESALNQGGFEVDVIDPVKKDIPEEIMQEELARVGLKISKEFMTFTRTSHASVYQFVGSARKAKGSPVHKKLAVNSPVDIFQDYLDNTKKHYEGVVTDLQAEVQGAEAQCEHRVEEIKQVEVKLAVLEKQMAAILNSKGWRFLEKVRKVSGRKDAS